MERHVEERSRWELHGDPGLTRPRTRRRSSQDARHGVTGFPSPQTRVCGRIVACLVGNPAAPAEAVPTDDVEARLFGSDEVAWSAISALVEAAPAAVSIDGAKVTHLHVERSLPVSDDIRIRVFVSGPGGEGFVDSDAAGAIISINGN